MGAQKTAVVFWAGLIKLLLTAVVTQKSVKNTIPVVQPDHSSGLVVSEAVDVAGEYLPVYDRRQRPGYRTVGGLVVRFGFAVFLEGGDMEETRIRQPQRRLKPHLVLAGLEVVRTLNDSAWMRLMKWT